MQITFAGDIYTIYIELKEHSHFNEELVHLYDSIQLASSEETIFMYQIYTIFQFKYPW